MAPNTKPTSINIYRNIASLERATSDNHSLDFPGTVVHSSPSLSHHHLTDLTMASPRNAAQTLALVFTKRRAMLSIRPHPQSHYRRIPLFSQPITSQHRTYYSNTNNNNNNKNKHDNKPSLSPLSSASPQHSTTRRKSSISLPPSINSEHHLHEVSSRATRNAAAFDAHHSKILSKHDTLFSTWRTRQMILTKRNPIRIHPKSPPNLIPPSPDLPSAYFPSYAHTGRVGPPQFPPDNVLLHDPPSVERMTRAARLARRLLDYVCHPSVARAGRTTEEIDALLHEATVGMGAYPSPLNYHGFPKSVCSSVNEVVCHGIPDSRALVAGDVVSFDVSCYVGGVHGDNCATIVVGDVEDDLDCDSEENQFSWDGYDDTATAADAPRPPMEDWPSVPIPPKTTFATPEEEERFVTARRLVRAALESRDEGVAACRPGGCLSDVGGAIHAVSDAYG